MKISRFADIGLFSGDLATFPSESGDGRIATKDDGITLLIDEPDQPQATEGPTDSIAGSPLTSATLAIGASETGVINTAGDHDWFRMQLVAGQSYVFTVTGDGATPLPDTYLELWGPHGLAAIDDDAGPGTDSLLRFTATETGTYYLNVQAFEDDTPTLTGGYQVSAAFGPPQDPLDAIDLGYTVPTQNITVYFATTGESFNGMTASRSWTAAEITAAMGALATYSAVTNLTFTQTANSTGATFVLSLGSLGSGVLGQFSTNLTTNVGYGVFSPTGTGWTTDGLQPGGLGFVTLLHEFGHGLGLAHPHDNGGNSEIMQGVLSPFDSYGTYGMNIGIFTTMTYNDGPRGYASAFNVTSGLQASPGPLDIALLQQRYGAHANVNAGNNTYVLPDVLQQGTIHQAIWDTGGTDAITYSGSRIVVIDLRAATLLNEVGGGGRLSYAQGAGGGYTIANGVTIENASSGSGNDQLFGNSIANVLAANGGDDTLWGGAGADTLNGGSGSDRVSHFDDVAGVTVNLMGGWAQDGWGNIDTLISIEEIEGSAYADVLIGGIGNAQGFSWINAGAGNDWVQDNSLIWGTIHGLEGDDTIFGGSAQVSIYGGDGDDTIVGGSADDFYLQGEYGDDYITGGDGNDGATGGFGDDEIHGGAGNDFLEGFDDNDIVLGDTGNDRITGGYGDDYIDGGDGNDVLDSGWGIDILIGGAGIDMMQAQGSWVDLAVGIFSATPMVGSTSYTVWTVFQSIEGVIGTSNADTLFGDAGANVLSGY